MNAAHTTPLMTQQECNEYRKQTNARLTNLRAWIGMLVTALSVSIVSVGGALWMGWVSAERAETVDKDFQKHRERVDERDVHIAATLKRLEDGQREIFTLLRTK